MGQLQRTVPIWQTFPDMSEQFGTDGKLQTCLMYTSALVPKCLGSEAEPIGGGL